MIREDGDLLAELARLNTDTPSLALRIMEGSASAREQARYAERIIVAGERLRQRAAATGETIIEEVVASVAHEQSVALPRIRWSLTGETFRRRCRSGSRE